MRPTLPRLTLVLALVLVPSTALAADPPARRTGDPAAAETLFYEARALMKQKKYTDACPKLEESLRLDSGLGTQFNLADCNEHIGKLATAWAGFRDVAAQAKATNQSKRERIARKRATALEARLPKLVIEVPEALAGLDVKRDGVVVGSAAWGTAIPVDPGVHEVTVRAAGKRPWSTSVRATERKTARVVVPRDLPAAPVAVPAAPIGTGVDTGRATSATTITSSAFDSALSFPPAVVENKGATQRALGWVATGVGAVGLGLAAGFGLSSLAKHNESRDHCALDVCDAAGVELRDDAIRNGNIATAAGIAGGAAALGGLILLVTAPRASRPRAGQLRALPNVAVGGGGVALQGSFR